VNVFPATVFADFETAIHNAVTTVWRGLEIQAKRKCYLGAGLGSYSMPFPFSAELVAENAIFGTQQAVWKEIL
jgi:hypothetical protein